MRLHLANLTSLFCTAAVAVWSRSRVVWLYDGTSMAVEDSVSAVHLFAFRLGCLCVLATLCVVIYSVKRPTNPLLSPTVGLLAILIAISAEFSSHPYTCADSMYHQGVDVCDRPEVNPTR